MKKVIWVAVGAALCPAILILAAETRPAAQGRGGAATTAPTTQARTPEQRKQDDINRVMEFFRITQPDVYEQAKSLRDTDPQKFEQLIMGAISTVNHLESLRKKSPQIFELSMQDVQLNYQSMRIAHELKRTDLAESDRKHMTEQLKTVVETDFDVQQRIRQLEIDDLRQKLKDLDNQVHAREGDKESIIRKRIEDLVQRTPRLEW